MATEPVKKEVKETLTEKVIKELNQPTIQYLWKGKKFIKNSKGEKVKSPINREKRGVLLATVDNDKVMIGFSLCNLKVDRFDYIKDNQEEAFGLSPMSNSGWQISTAHGNDCILAT